MAKSKIISASIAVDIQNLQEITGAVQGLGQELSTMKIDKNIESRLKNVEKTLAGATQQINTITNKLDVLSKAGGLDPKVLADMAMLTSTLTDTKIAVDALEAKFNNLSNSIKIGDVGIKNITQNITNDIGNMTNSINESLTETATAIKRGGKEIVDSYNSLLEWIKTEKLAADDLTHGDSAKAIEIFKIEDADDLDAKIDKVKKRLQNDLKDFAKATEEFNNAKLGNADSSQLEKFAEKQAEALDKLKTSFTAFYNYADLDHLSGEKIPRGIQNSLKTITTELGGLEGKTFKTFEEIYDFIDTISANIENNIVTTIKSIEGAVEEANKAEVLTKRTSTKKDKSSQKETNKEIRTGVVVKEGTDAELIAELKTVLDNLQKYVDTHPIELNAIINPTWGTTQTQKYLKSIREQLSKKNGNIDEALAARIYGLQDAFGKDFSEALNKSISKLKDSLQKEGFSVGKLKIEDTAVKDFKEQISNEIGAITVDINANILGTTIVDKDKIDAVNQQFEELRALGKLDPGKISDLVKTIKDTGADLDYSDIYKDRLKQIVKGLVDGVYGSVPEAIAKTKYPQGADPLAVEYNNDKARLDALIERAKGEISAEELVYLKSQTDALVKRMQDILVEVANNSSLANDEKSNENLKLDDENIKEVFQQIQSAAIAVGTATINVGNADATFTNITTPTPTEPTPAETVAKEVPAKVEEVAQVAETTLVATREELVSLANQRFKELANSDNIDFKAIESLVSDLRKIGVESINPKLTNNTVGRTVDAMFKGGYTSALEAFKSTTSHSKEAQAKALEIQQLSKLTERFQKLYAMQTVQEKGTGSEKSIQMFVDAVRKSGVDFKVNPKNQDNEIGKLVNSMLTEGYKTVAEAIAARDNKPIEQPQKKNIEKATINVTNLTIKGQQNIEKVTQKVTSANIEVKKGNATIAGATTAVKNPDENKSVPAPDTTKAEAKVDKKLQSLIDKYNQNVNNVDNMPLKDFLKKQEKLLSDMDLVIQSNQNNNRSTENIEAKAEVSAAETLNSIDSKIENEEDVTREDVAEANRKLDELLRFTDSDDRYELFKSGEIYQAGYAHELSYNLYGDDRFYEPNSARTLLKKGSTSSALVSADTVETIHNHPDGNITPSIRDLISWFDDVKDKLEDVETLKYDGYLDSESFNKFIATIIGSNGDMLRFNMSDILKLDESSRNQIRDKLLKGSIASYLYELETGKDFSPSYLDYLTGADGTFKLFNVDEDHNLTQKELSNNLSDYEIKILNDLYDYIDHSFNLKSISDSNKQLGDYDIIRNFAYEHSDELVEILNSGEPVDIMDDMVHDFIEKYNDITSQLESMKNNGEHDYDLETLHDNMENIYRFIQNWDEMSDFEKIDIPNALFDDMGMFLNNPSIEDSSSLYNEIPSNNKLNKNTKPLLQEYLNKIDELISSTTDEVLKTNLKNIRKELFNNGAILAAPLSLDKTSNIEDIKEAIQGIRQNINSVNEITTTLSIKSKQVDGLLKSVGKLNKTISSSEELNLASKAQRTIEDSAEELSALQMQLETAQQNNDYSEIDVEAITQRILELQENVGDAITQTVVDKVDIKGLIRKLDNLQIDEVKADPEVVSQVKTLRKRLQDIVDDDAKEMLTEQYKSYAKQVSQLSGTISKSDRTIFGNFMKELRHKNYQALAQFFSLNDIIRYMREAVNVIKQYDTALVEMMKVSDETRASLERYQETLFDTADAIGSAALTLEKSTADWMRIGESLTEAAKSAQAAQILMNVSEFQSIDEATQALVSASQAYADLDKMDIVDKINKLGNEFPIATDQLATALQNSAAALTTQGNSLDEALALVVGGNVITQDALKTGTGIRTIALRIAGTKEAKDELAELGEGIDDFVVRTESKTRQLIMDYTAVASNGFKGVDIYDDNGNLRSTYQILQDIADVYKEIQLEDRQAGTNRANALVELLAGKNRSNIAASILTNPDTIREAYEAAQNAEGSAMKENEKYLTSVEAHITKFKNAVDELITSLVDSGFINDVIDFGTTLVKLLQQITEGLGGVGTALAAIGTAAAIKGHVFSGGGKGLVKLVKTATSSVGSVLSLTDVTNPDFDLSMLANNGLTEEAGKYLQTLKGISEVESAMPAITKAVAEADNIAAAAAAKHAAATTLLKTAKLGLAAIIATTVIVAINKYKQKIEEAKKASRDLATETRDQAKSLDEYAKRIAKAKEVIADERSTTDEIIDAKKELVTIQDELNESYNNYNEIIKNVNSSLEENNRQLIANRQLALDEAVADAAKSGEGKDARKFFEEEFKVSRSGPVWDYIADAFGEYFTKGEGSVGSIVELKGTTPEEQLKYLQAIRHEIIMSEDELDDGWLTQIDDEIARIEEGVEKYTDTYLNEGENTARRRYSSEYNNLQEAWYTNLQEGSEETVQNLTTQIEELYNKAIANSDQDVANWLRQSYANYFENINNAILQNNWNSDITSAIKAINQRHGERDFYELTYEDIIAAHNGDDLNGKISESQKELIDILEKAFANAGIDFIQGIDEAVKRGLIGKQGDIDFHAALAEYRNQAIGSGLMTEEEFDSLNISNSEELDIWRDKVWAVRDSITDASQAIQMFNLAVSDVGETLDASTMLKNMEDQYAPVFNSMAEAYKAIWENGVFSGTDKVGSDQIEGVRAQIEGLNSKLKEAGATGFETDDINEFILTLSDAEATEKEVQDAFNNLATVLVDSLNPELGAASAETAELMQKTLTDMGVTNAAAVVYSRLGYTLEEYNAAKEVAEKNDLDLDASIGSLNAEQLALIADNEALTTYYGNRVLVNSFDLNTADDVKSLVNLAETLGLATVGSLKLAEAQKYLARIMDYAQSAAEASDERTRRRYEALRDKTIEKFEKEARYSVEALYDGNTARSSSSSDKSASETKQKFDWIERAIKKVQRAISNLGKVADATYKRWDERLSAIIGKNENFVDEIGQFGRGNIDLYNRPQYMGIDDEYEQDAVTETVRSMAQQDESGRWILVPTIDWDEHGMPREMSNGEAWDHYLDTGEYLGIFETLEEADDYAERLHLQQAAIYTDYDNFVNGKQQKLKEEIALQQQAADAYMQEANAIGLAAEYRDKVMNGMMDIETITDETLKEQISDFQEYYDKATDAADAVEDLRGELASLAQTKFDMITKQFDEMAIEIDHTATRIGHIQSQMESQGFFESYSLIEQLLFGDEEKLDQKQREAVALAKSIDDAVASGSIEYGSEQWWNMYDALQDVNDQVVELQANIAEFEKQMRQLDWSNFDYVREVISDIVDENNFYIEMLESDNPLFEKASVLGSDIMVENGNWTDSAYAIQGLHVNNIDVLQDQAEEVGREIKDIEAQLAENPYDKDLLDRYRELRKQHQSYIKDIAKEKQAIKDLKKQGYEAFLNYLQKSIDKRKKALEAQKSLFDYQNTIEEQTKSVTDYRKQLAVLGNGSDTEENRARIQTLSENLKKAEKELQQTEYERWLSDQEQMMDDMYESFENLINLRLDDLDALIAEAIKQSKTNSGDISKTIENEAKEYGYDPYNSPFGINIDDRMSNVIGALDRVKLTIDSMWDEAEEYAKKQLDALDNLATTFVTHANSEEQTPVTVNVDTSDTSSSSTSTSTDSTSTTTYQGDDDRNGRHKEQGTGFDKNDDGVHKTQGSSSDNNEKLEELQTEYNDLERKYDNAMQMKKSYDGRAAKEANLSKKNELLTTAADYAAKAKEYSDAMDKLQKQINALKKSNGKFAKGGTIGKAIKSTGEDGIILARSGEEVLSLERVKQMQSLFKMMQPLAALGTNKTISNIGGSTTVNGMNVSFELPNVTSYEDFVRQAKSDPTFEKMVQNMTIGTALGKSKLSKYSI